MFKCRTEPDIKKLDALVKVAAQILSNSQDNQGQINEPSGLYKFLKVIVTYIVAGGYKKKSKKRV